MGDSHENCRLKSEVLHKDCDYRAHYMSNRVRTTFLASMFLRDATRNGPLMQQTGIRQYCIKIYYSARQVFS